MESIDHLKSMKGVKMVHVNTRSLFGKLDQICNAFSDMDVIVISETWLNPSIPDSSIAIPGFSIIRQDRNCLSGKRGGGLCIYVKSKFKMDMLDNTLYMTTKDFEIIGITLKHPFIKPFKIIGVYRPPTGTHKVLLEHLDKCLMDIVNPRVETFILGDFNIDYSLNTIKKRYGLDKLESKFNLKQIINTYTRQTQTTNTIIDWIYTDCPHVAKSGTLNLNLSDHLPIFLVRKKLRNEIEKHTTTGRSYIHYDSEDFCQLFSQQDWTSFDDSEEINEMWEIIEKNISKSLDVHCPIRTIRVSDTKPVWLNNEIIQLMRRRDKAYKRARRTKSDIDWRKATFLRNRVESFIQNYKKRTIINKLETHQHNPNKFWKEIRSIMPKEQQAEVLSLSDEGSNITYEDADLCNHINSYF